VRNNDFLSIEFYVTFEADQKDILQTAAAQLGRQESVLEKDVWVCWALETLFSMPNAHPMAFKGGTSLSKVYDIMIGFRHTFLPSYFAGC
jgi:hypothetical protein